MPPRDGGNRVSLASDLKRALEGESAHPPGYSSAVFNDDRDAIVLALTGRLDVDSEALIRAKAREA